MLEENPIELGKKLEGLGAGEILLQSIDNDGLQKVTILKL